MDVSRMNRFLFRTFAIAFLATALSACVGGKKEQQDTTKAASEQIADFSDSHEDVLLVATDASNAPYEMRDEEGQVIGFDVDLIRAIAEKQGFRVQILNQPWDGIFETLENGTRDVVMAPLTITEERKQKVDFTDPYIYPTRTAFLTKETAARNKVKTFEDLRNLTIACKGNTTNESALRDIFGQDHDKILSADTQYLAFRKMLGNNAQVAFGDTVVLRYHAKISHTDLSDLVQIDQPMKPQEVRAAFAVKKGNVELLAKLNEGLKQVRADGTYRQIAEKWLDPESAERASAEQ